jgi:hypothetical protein
MVGAFMAGNTYIYLKRLIKRIDENDYESDQEEDGPLRIKKTMKVQVQRDQTEMSRLNFEQNLTPI